MQPFAFTGYQEDEVSGLKFAQARFYSAENGRFVGEDQVKGLVSVPESQNHYVYCVNAPTYLIDGNGKWVQFAIGAAVGLVTGVATEVISAKLSGQEIKASAVFGAAVGGAVGGVIAATGNTALAATVSGAVSNGLSTLITDTIDIATHSSDMTALDVAKHVAGNTIIGGVTSFGSFKLADKVLPKVMSKADIFKVEYANKRMAEGAFALGETLRRHGSKYLTYYAVNEGIPFGLDTIVATGQKWWENIKGNINQKEDKTKEATQNEDKYKPTELINERIISTEKEEYDE
ncbi:RHS repeat-associated core domain-containing protein [Pseudobutyrivibrio xylanivorans]|uniref:RHS repeat-associated core domain-containing protein n=1 Tax=Pseudobutyrivibrio xylanivorans TaxID=185007 RepID=UPI0024200ADD|nr:RHS repeat-associated core domain-containing protein [Pseudobutyrivibrio xylanivorans]